MYPQVLQRAVVSPQVGRTGMDGQSKRDLPRRVPKDSPGWGVVLETAAVRKRHESDTKHTAVPTGSKIKTFILYLLVLCLRELLNTQSHGLSSCLSPAPPYVPLPLPALVGLNADIPGGGISPGGQAQSTQVIVLFQRGNNKNKFES